MVSILFGIVDFKKVRSLEVPEGSSNRLSGSANIILLSGSLLLWTQSPVLQGLNSVSELGIFILKILIEFLKIPYLPKKSYHVLSYHQCKSGLVRDVDKRLTNFLRDRVSSRRIRCCHDQILLRSVIKLE